MVSSRANTRSSYIAWQNPGILRSDMLSAPYIYPRHYSSLKQDHVSAWNTIACTRENVQVGKTPLILAVEDPPQWMQTLQDQETMAKRSQNIPDIVRLLLVNKADVNKTTEVRGRLRPFLDLRVQYTHTHRETHWFSHKYTLQNIRYMLLSLARQDWASRTRLSCPYSTLQSWVSLILRRWWGVSCMIRLQESGV